MNDNSNEKPVDSETVLKALKYFGIGALVIGLAALIGGLLEGHTIAIVIGAVLLLDALLTPYVIKAVRRRRGAQP